MRDCVKNAHLRRRDRACPCPICIQTPPYRCRDRALRRFTDSRRHACPNTIGGSLFRRYHWTMEIAFSGLCTLPLNG